MDAFRSGCPATLQRIFVRPSLRRRTSCRGVPRNLFLRLPLIPDIVGKVTEPYHYAFPKNKKGRVWFARLFFHCHLRRLRSGCVGRPSRRVIPIRMISGLEVFTARHRRDNLGQMTADVRRLPVAALDPLARDALGIGGERRFRLPVRLRRARSP